MTLFILSFLCLFFSPTIQRVFCGNKSGIAARDRASLPPRGWNSYDSFCWVISEEQFMQNAQLLNQRLRAHGYEYAVLDYLWYRKNVNGSHTNAVGFDIIDQWGRLVPDPERWPSSRNGKGLSEVANKVHGMGLKFGFHVMGGLSLQAFNANTPILNIRTGKAYEEGGRKWYARDIGIKERKCKWMPGGFMSVNTSLGAGRAFLRSLYKQYTDWGVDLVKNDCVFGDDLDLGEIRVVSRILRGARRPIVYSLSPGTNVTAAMAQSVNKLVNMYRITGDDWDKWGDVLAHFNVTRDLAAANLIGAEGLQGKSWPDLDMLPLGWLTDADSNEGPYRKCNLTLNEQRSQMTLWSMAKSPLMFGGDMRNLDDTTYGLITNPTLLEINSFSSNNMEFPFISVSSKGAQSANKGVQEAHSLELISCMDSKATGWTTKPLDDKTEQVCWKDSSNTQTPICLNKRENGLMSNKETNQGTFHLMATHKPGSYLDASPKRDFASDDFMRDSFSPYCQDDQNQMWVFNQNRTLQSSLSGQCAMINNVKADADSGGTRSWIATGRKGEIYLAFFNLNSQQTEISTKISDLAKALPKQNLNKVSCLGKELWSGKDLGVIKDALSMPVESHASAVLVLNCK